MSSTLTPEREAYLNEVCVFLERGLDLSEARRAATTLQEAAVASRGYTEAFHPRGRGGEWTKVPTATEPKKQAKASTKNRQGAMKTRDMEKMLKKAGFVQVRQTGSHARFKHPDGRMIGLPMHARTVPRGLMVRILHDANLA